jgi:TolB-like protein
MKEALRRISILSAVLFLFLLPGAEGASLSVAVQPFLSQGTEFHLGPAVSEIVSTSLAGARNITVVERMRLAEVARQHRLSMSGVVDTATAATAGKLSGARYFLLGAVSRFGALLVVTARLVDVESGRVLGSFEQTSRQGEDEIVLVSRNLSAELLAFFSGDAPAPGDPLKDYRYYLYEALGYYNLGEYRKSLPFWEKMTQLSPRNGLLRFIAAGIYFQAGRHSDALIAAQQAVTWDPSFAEAHLLVGKAYFLLGDNHKATPPLDRAWS